MNIPKALRISVVNFWDKAFKNDFFDYIVSRVTNGLHEYVENPDNADIVLTSVYGRTPFPNRKTVAYIGENIRPNIAAYRYTLSFDRDTFGGRNCHLPLWYARLAWPGFVYVNERDDGINTHGYEELIPISALTTARVLPVNQFEKQFCALVAGNPESLRVSLYILLSQYKKINGYGKMFGKPLFSSKFDLLSNYKFCFCPENSFAPGYVTEKLFDAWYGGTVPIWYGPNESGQGLNPDSFINYYDSLNAEQFINKIASLDQSPTRYEEVFSQPLLLKAPTLDHVIEFLDNAFVEITKG